MKTIHTSPQEDLCEMDEELNQGNLVHENWSPAIQNNLESVEHQKWERSKTPIYNMR